MQSVLKLTEYKERHHKGLFMSSVPFWLTIEIAEEMRFRLVGECYVHALMGGEVMGDGEVGVCEFEVV